MYILIVHISIITRKVSTSASPSLPSPLLLHIRKPRAKASDSRRRRAVGQTQDLAYTKQMLSLSYIATVSNSEVLKGPLHYIAQ